MPISSAKASIGTSFRSKLILSGALLACSSVFAGAQAWVAGDVLAGVGNGQYNVYSNAGVYKGTITDSFSNGYTTGCAFTSTFNKLYTTNFSNDSVTVFDGTGTTHPVLSTISTASSGSSNESVVFDMAGNYYVGHADGAHGVSKYSSADTLTTTLYPQTEYRGTDWVDLAKDQQTIFYTSEGLHLKRYQGATDTQLADFAGPFPGSNAYAHRLLPPYDGSAGALIADTSEIVRIDSTGTVVKTYTVSGASAWFSLNLDPNGTSFWAGDLGSSLLYRFNIATGAVEVGPINTIATNGNQLAGVCVKGELTIISDTTPPVVTVQNIVSGPPKEVILSTHDTQSGLKTLQILSCTNCSAVNGAFTIGTNANVLTTATKTNQSESSTIKIEATDVAGNTTIFDPVDFEVHDGVKQKSNTINISPLESVIMIANGTPGVRDMEIKINETTLPRVILGEGASKMLNISKHLIPSIQNKVEITAYGPTGASAWVVITQP